MIHTDEEYPVMNTRSDESRIEITYDYGVTPSDMLRQRMHELGMSQTQLAMRTGLSRKTINELVHGKQSITHETALLLEPVLGYAARFWMDMQHGYDAQKASHKRKVAESRFDDWPHVFSAAATHAMQLDVHYPQQSVLTQLPHFFGVASYDAYTQSYGHMLQATSFRRHRQEVNPHDIAVWLRLGQRSAESCQLAPFNERRLRQVLDDCKALTTQTPAEFWQPLVNMFAACGVLLVWIPPITGIALSGATYVHADKRVIQLSGRDQTNDRFWFTLFHEIGHILLHGVKPLFAEWDDADTHTAKDSEREANNFAATHLIPPALLAPLLTKSRLSTADIVQMAQRAQVHPGIVAGRIQHERRNFATYRRLLLQYNWDFLMNPTDRRLPRQP